MTLQISSVSCPFTKYILIKHDKIKQTIISNSEELSIHIRNASLFQENNESESIYYLSQYSKLMIKTTDIKKVNYIQREANIVQKT